MGANKALLDLDGKSLAVRGVEKLQRECAEVAIAGGVDELAEIARMIPDMYPMCGPLGGIVSALEQSRLEWNLFLAVDMPFVPAHVLRALIGSAAEGGSVILAEAEGRIQPLCGIYSRAALLVLRQQLLAGRYKVKDAAIATGGLRLISFNTLGWFRNLNTPEEFAEASDR